MNVGARIVDPVFGNLEMDYAWLGKARVEALGGNVILAVEGDDPPADEQRKAFEEFIKNQMSIREELEWALFEYYNHDFWLWLHRLFWRLPKLKNPGDIWELVCFPGVTVAEAQGRALPRVSISWECNWDPEHGVEVILEEGKAIYTGLIGEGPE